MIPGFNHNIQYKGQVFHIQTEDSGKDNPHVITHLFVGGNIVDSRKMSYADIVRSDKLEDVVVDLMQDQHKQMLKDLISGSFDSKIQQRAQGASHLNGPAPLNVEKGQGKASVMMPNFDKVKAAKKKAPAEASISVAAANASTAPTAAAKPAEPKPAPAKESKVINADALAKAFKSENKNAINSIFGEDLISEKSLDEVILSYLAEDVTGG